MATYVLKSQMRCILYVESDSTIYLIWFQSQKSMAGSFNVGDLPKNDSQTHFENFMFNDIYLLWRWNGEHNWMFATYKNVILCSIWMRQQTRPKIWYDVAHLYPDPDVVKVFRIFGSRRNIYA